MSIFALFASLCFSQPTSLHAAQTNYDNLTFKDLFPRVDEVDWVVPYGPTTGQRVMGGIFQLLGVAFFMAAGLFPWHIVTLLQYMEDKNSTKFSDLLNTHREIPTNQDSKLHSVPLWIWVPCLLIGTLLLWSLLNKMLVYEQLSAGKEGMMIPSSALKRSFMKKIAYFFTYLFNHQPFYVRYDQIAYAQDITQAVIVTEQSQSGVQQKIRRFGTTLQHSKTQTTQKTIHVRRFIIHTVDPRTNEARQYSFYENDLPFVNYFGLMMSKILEYRGVKVYKEVG